MGSKSSKNPILNNTPVEKHIVLKGLYTVWVKREDLCSIDPWPKFSKIRGIVSHISAQQAGVIGVLDTFHSQGGWAVAAACKYLGKDCINFWPRYKAMKKGERRKNQRRSKALGAKLVAFQAGRSAILYHRAKKYMADLKSSYMMPNALKLPETMRETAYEVHVTDMAKFDNIVIPISSGTVAAGVLQGLVKKKHYPRIFIHLGYTRSKKAVRAYLRQNAPGFPQKRIKIIDEGYAYKDQARGSMVPPFPCNPYYDLKAWQWLLRARPKGRTLFWNIGA